jgi:hypothetical protein
MKKRSLLPMAITRYSSALELKNYLSWSPVTLDTWAFVEDLIPLLSRSVLNIEVEGMLGE